MADKIPSKQFAKHEICLPAPAPGTTRQLSVFRYGDPGARPKVYIQTALHADEIPGMLVLHHLRKRLDMAAEKGGITGEIVIVPVANPIGMAQRIQGGVTGRLDLNNGKNYNRHYPHLAPEVADLIAAHLTFDENHNDRVIRDALKQAVSELPDASEGDAYRKSLLALCADADFCLDLHCDLESVLYMYSSGSHGQLADELCAQLGCEIHLVDSTNNRCFDGTISLAWVSIAKRFPDFPILPGCMGATIEYRGMSDVSDEFAESDAANLMQFLVNQNVVNGVQTTVPEPKCAATAIEAQIYIQSPRTGIVVFKKRCGDRVQSGEIVAEIIDPLESPGSARTALKSRISGKVMSHSVQRLVGPGQIVMAIAGKEILPERVGSYLLSD